MRRYGLLLALGSSAALGCSGDEAGDAPPAPTPTLTYYADAKAIVDQRCAGCHRPGDIGPFPLTSYEEVQTFAPAMRASIESGRMPPWQPSDDCNSYEASIALTDEEKTTLLAWIDQGAAAGDPADAPAAPSEPEAPAFVADLQLRLPEPYAPTRAPDDYRCQLIPWPADEVRYVTGLRVQPDERAIVHHVIAFLIGPDQVEQFRAFDEAEAGPGYTCYGGPRASTEGGSVGNVDPAALLAALDRLGLSVADLRSGNLTDAEIAALLDELGGGSSLGFRTLGSWVPGAPAGPYPAGTGIRVEPGSMIVAQVHYNSVAANPPADQSTLEIATAAEVDRQATTMPLVDLGWVTNGMFGEPMTIPAGAAEVSHSTTLTFDSAFMARARNELGLAEDAPLVIHSANHHMHELGRRQRTEIRRADGNMACVLDIPDWDFAWQGAYTLQESLTIREGDSVWMGCTWDNSAANQPTVDGVQREPVDVSWGEGTSDEMCLGSFYVTGQ